MPQSDRSSLARRAALALMLFAGFYTLAVVIMGLLGLLIVADISSGHFHAQAVLTCVIGFIAILAAIIPRADKFEPTWPRMTADQHPMLFAKLEAIAGAASQRMPDEVYLLPELNAWVMDRGRRGERRVMGIGLPLIQLLNVSQLTAVIAHEFGHYYGGDTRLGPWIHRTHAAIARTLQNLNKNSMGVIQAPFNAYGRMFLRVSRSVSREQEYTADRFAAMIAGPEALITSLKRLAGYQVGVDTFWGRLVMPVLGCGYRPPIIGGLTLMARSDCIADAAEDFALQVIEKAEESPLDTHPCLRDRIAALSTCPAGAAVDPEPALTLLGDLPLVEEQILRMYASDDYVAKLAPVEWDEVADRVFIAAWMRLRDQNRELIQSFTLDEIGAVPYMDLERAAEVRNVSGKHVAPGERRFLLVAVASGCLGLALCDAGWRYMARPDYLDFFVRDGESIDIERAMDAILNGRLSQEQWANDCRQMGISGMLMTGGMSPTGPGRRWANVLPVFTPGVRYEGGNGAAIDTAIIIVGAKSKAQGIAAQMLRLREWFGIAQKDWHFTRRSRLEHRGRQVDLVEFVLKNGKKRFLYFDMTQVLADEREPPASGDTKEDTGA